MTLGVRVLGDKVEDVDVGSTTSKGFKAVPIPAMLGVPLMYKCLPKVVEAERPRSNVIVPMMSDPELGLAPMEWQYGGAMGPAPPVLLGRQDGLPFSKQDWKALDEYVHTWSSTYTEEGQKVAERLLKPDTFRCHVQRSCPGAFLPIHFPLGTIVTPQGLSQEDLNGLEGEVVQFNRERVGVQFEGRGIVALRAERLALVREVAIDVPMAERQPTAEEHKVAAEQKEARTADLRRQEARRLAKSLAECVNEDVLPREDEGELFGLHGRAERMSSALGAWKELLRQDYVTEDSLTDALVAGTQHDLFKEMCTKAAKAPGSRATYATELVKLKFRGVEFDRMD